MKPTDFPRPNPTPIDDFSPSLANHLLSCQLRVGFARDPVHKAWRRPNTYSALGLAAHSVAEAAFKQRNWPEAQDSEWTLLNSLWEEQIELQKTTLARAWAPASPPPPDEWPGYALTRVRTIRRARKQLDARAATRSTREHGTGAEIELRDARSGLFGRADRIEQDGRATRVVDLKTGLRQAEPTPLQQRQLLLYAVLVQRTTGQWPSSIAVEDASGNRYSQPLDPDEAEVALSETRAAVNSFNAAAASSSLLANAKPNQDQCRWCDYRVLCEPFWDALTSEWGQRSALGSVVGLGESNEGAFVSIAVNSPRDRAGTRIHVAGLPAPLSSGITKVAITDWTGMAEADDVRARWSTTIRAW